jgi:hypothetical protein
MNKSRFLTIFVLIAILLSAFAVSSVQAKTDPTVKNTVKNKTGGEVQMSLTGPDGKTYYSFGTGWGSFNIQAGIYSYYVLTPCGALSGQINLTRAKMIVFSCTADGPHLDVFVPNPPAPPGPNEPPPPPPPPSDPCLLTKFGATINPACDPCLNSKFDAITTTPGCDPCKFNEFNAITNPGC